MRKKPLLRSKLAAVIDGGRNAMCRCPDRKSGIAYLVYLVPRLILVTASLSAALAWAILPDSTEKSLQQRQRPKVNRFRASGRICGRNRLQPHKTNFRSVWKASASQRVLQKHFLQIIIDKLCKFLACELLLREYLGVACLKAAGPIFKDGDGWHHCCDKRCP